MRAIVTQLRENLRDNFWQKNFSRTRTFKVATFDAKCSRLDIQLVIGPFWVLIGKKLIERVLISVTPCVREDAPKPRDAPISRSEKEAIHRLVCRAEKDTGVVCLGMGAGYRGAGPNRSSDQSQERSPERETKRGPRLKGMERA